MIYGKQYSIEFKHKLVAQLVGGISLAELSQKVRINSKTLKRWKDEYLSGDVEETISKTELLDLRKKNGELSVMLADALLV